VIRTLDLGADKFSSVSGAVSGEKNPFLGLRSVRLCLHNIDLFKTQLRAILRAAVHGDLRVMFPMISTVDELRQCKTLLNEVKEDLEYAGIPFKREVPVGTMIEVPSAALLADVLAREVDFFSIGTNDLIQYTLAADRNNEHVANLYQPADPAVLRLIQTVVQAAQREQKRRPFEVNVCGEMSGEPLFIPLLVGMGLRQLSATPRKIPEIKRVIRDLTVAEAERIAKEALTRETARQVSSYLRNELRRTILPSEAVDCGRRFRASRGAPKPPWPDPPVEHARGCGAAGRVKSQRWEARNVTGAGTAPPRHCAPAVFHFALRRPRALPPGATGGASSIADYGSWIAD
jgi:phosphotransferase system enzyme I (PtsI)